VNPIGDIPGCILHSACTRIIRKTPPIMIIRTLHRDPDVCPWHVRSDGSSYVIGKRAVSFLPFVIAFACSDADDFGSPDGCPDRCYRLLR